MKPRAIPSSKEANRLIALATRMPPGFSTPVRLAERRQPLFARGQVVERSHQEHDIGAAGSVRQGAGIADGCAPARGCSGCAADAARACST